jgi:hypothetical protein
MCVCVCVDKLCSFRLSLYTPRYALRSSEVWGIPGFSHNLHMKVARRLALRTNRLYSAGKILVLISARCWVDPWALVRPEKLSQLTGCKSPSEIEAATFRLQLHYSTTIYYGGSFMVYIDTGHIVVLVGTNLREFFLAFCRFWTVIIKPSADWLKTALDEACFLYSFERR